MKKSVKKVSKTGFILLAAIMSMLLSATIASAASIPLKVQAVSSEYVDNPQAQAIDGKADTFWHTNYDPQADAPHWITVDLGGQYSVNQLKYLPRQDQSWNPTPNGSVSKYKVYVSLDNKTFTNVASGEWEPNKEEKTVTFKAVDAKYVKFESVSDTHMVVAKLEVHGTQSKAAAPDATTTAPNTSVNTSAPVVEANPQTGDSGVALYAFIAFAAAMVLVVSYKYKTNRGRS